MKTFSANIIEECLSQYNYPYLYHFLVRYYHNIFIIFLLQQCDMNCYQVVLTCLLAELLTNDE